MSIITEETRDIIRWNDQTKAVAAYLEKYGSVYKHDCTRGEGLPGYGVIEHPGARIFDLREMGWNILTEKYPTRWKLISKPAPEQLSLAMNV